MRCLVVGANSDIAKALTFELAKNNMFSEFTLLARDEESLIRYANDLGVRFKINVTTHALDLSDNGFNQLADYYSSLAVKPDCVIYAIGYLSKTSNNKPDLKDLCHILDLNYSAAVVLFELVAHDFIVRGSGLAIGISSVAGIRGRQSNYVYGSAKAGFLAYFSGLRNRLFSHNCHVMTVLPGFVSTKMTATMNLPKLLTVTPETMANRIIKGIRKKQNTVYSSSVWLLIMLIIRLIPEPIFKRLKL